MFALHDAFTVVDVLKAPQSFYKFRISCKVNVFGKPIVMRFVILVTKFNGNVELLINLINSQKRWKRLKMVGH